MHSWKSQTKVPDGQMQSLNQSLTAVVLKLFVIITPGSVVIYTFTPTPSSSVKKNIESLILMYFICKELILVKE